MNQEKKWGDEGLSRYLNNVAMNTEASFHANMEEYELLSNISCIFDLAENHPEPIAPWLMGFLLVRAKQAFRAAAGHALSGQLPEAYLVMRGSVEAALYGFSCACNNQLVQIYMGRVADDEGRRAFTPCLHSDQIVALR